MKTILALTDFSRAAENAVERAAMLAARLGAALQLVHRDAHSGHEHLPERMTRLDMRAWQLEKRWGIAVTRPARGRELSHCLCVADSRMAEQRDLFGDRPWAATLLGGASAPLLVVRQAARQEAHPRPYRTVLLPHVTRAQADTLQGAAARWFADAAAVLLRIVPDAAAHEWPPPASAARLESVGADVPGVQDGCRKGKHALRGGDAVHQIAHQAEHGQADLVIVTLPPAGAWQRVSRGTFQERLVRRLGCDLLVLPQEWGVSRSDLAFPLSPPASDLAQAHARPTSSPSTLVSVHAGAPAQPPVPGVAANTAPVLLAWTDLSAQGQAHLEKAAALAATRGLRLRLGYCSPPKAMYDAPTVRLKQRARHLRRLFDMPVEVVEEEARTADALRRQLQQCSLTCVARGSTPQSANLLRRLLQQRVAPVLVFQSGGEARYDRILAPVAITPHSHALVRWAGLFDAAAQVDLLHVSGLPGGVRESATPSVLDQFLRKACLDMSRKMQALMPAMGRARSYRHHLAHGDDVAAQVAAFQAEGRHALVIVGLARRPGGLGGWMGVDLCRPSLAWRLCQGLAADVLVVPQPPLSWREAWGGTP